LRLPVVNEITIGILQGWVQFPTGGIARDSAFGGLNRRISGADSIVWMEEEWQIYPGLMSAFSGFCCLSFPPALSNTGLFFLLSE